MIFSLELKHLSVATAILLSSGLASAAYTVPASCVVADSRSDVYVSNTDSGVSNRTVTGSTCTVGALINLDGNWANRASFLANVTSVVSTLQGRGDLNSTEASSIQAAAQLSDGGKYLKVGVIAFNDFHGNIQAPSGSASYIYQTTGSKLTYTDYSGNTGKTAVGGAAYVASWIKHLKLNNPNNVVVGSGDMINAAPFVSSLFHNEPAIVALNEMGVELSSVGNHEFDYGTTELLRMQNGGCHPVDGCQFDTSFPGASFQYLSANVVNKTSSQPLFPAYRIKDFKGHKIAFIGLTLRDTPTIVNPTGVAAYDFKDEADTVNALIPRLRAQGVNAFVVLIHQGDSHTGTAAAQYNDYNGCSDVSGSVDEILARLSSYVDVVVSAHTHQAYICSVNGRLLTQAGYYGRFLTEIDLTLDTATHKIVAKTAANIPVTQALAPDATVQATVDKAVAESAAADRLVGSVTAPIYKDGNYQNESALGDVIADAMLWGTSSADKGGAVAAFMNPGGLRADLTPANNQVMFSNLFNIQPFTNYLTIETVTGAQIKELLEEQFTGYTSTDASGKAYTQPYDKVLQVSGVSYSWSASAALGSKVDASTILIQGSPIDLSASYRIVVNNFMAAGGDNFSVLTKGTNVVTGDVDVNATEAYFKANSPVAPGAKNRITKLP